MRKTVFIAMMLALVLVSSTAFGLRIKSGDVARKVVFTAYDSTDPNNVTVVTSLTDPNVDYSIDGGSKVRMTTPTITAIDDTDMPGAFSLAIDEPNMVTITDVNEAQLYIYVSSSNAYAVPVSVELYKDDTATLISYGAATATNVDDVNTSISAALLTVEDVNTQAQNALAFYGAATAANVEDVNVGLLAAIDDVNTAVIAVVYDVNDVIVSAISDVNSTALTKADVNDCTVGIDWSRISEPNTVVNLKQTTVRRVFDSNYVNPEGGAYRAIIDSVTPQQ